MSSRRTFGRELRSNHRKNSTGNIINQKIHRASGGWQNRQFLGRGLEGSHILVGAVHDCLRNSTHETFCRATFSSRNILSGDVFLAKKPYLLPPVVLIPVRRPPR